MDPILVTFLLVIPNLTERCPFLETLTGLSTIRAYREQAGRFYACFFLLFSYMIQNRCIRDAEHGLDLENRAYLMTISMQRWLAVRLDLLGNILVLGIALFATGFRTTVSPSKIGVVLSYTLAGRFMRNILRFLRLYIYIYFYKWPRFSVSDDQVFSLGEAEMVNG